MKINRRKIKVTYINPAPSGTWGMHDGYGTWPDNYRRIFGVLLCKAHWTIPVKSYDGMEQVYVFNCRKCEAARKYEARKNRILQERAKGRLVRLMENEEYKIQRNYYVQALKRLYDGKG